jgi:hypothetical protein
MCELFGLSSSRPVSLRGLLCRFRERGGDVADNPDGWGLATLQDGVFSIAKEPHAAAQSAHFQGLCEQTFSPLIVGHARIANPPTARVLANTHPFRCELHVYRAGRLIACINARPQAMSTLHRRCHGKNGVASVHGQMTDLVESWTEGQHGSRRIP